MNQWLIGSRGDRIVFLRPLPQSFTPAEAYNLAAWLVGTCGADVPRFRDELERILRNEDTIDEAPPQARAEDRRCPHCWLPVGSGQGTVIKNGWTFHLTCWESILKTQHEHPALENCLCTYCGKPIASLATCVAYAGNNYHRE